MLRLAVLLLLLANGLYYAWAGGLLLQWGLGGPMPQTEPHRLTQQIRPEAIRVLSPDEARQLVAGGGPARPAECLQAGPVEDGAAQSLRQALASWPAGSWTLESVSEPARWIVYMGKYADVEQVARKRAELRQLGITFEPLANPELEPGLSLGGYPSESAAGTRLNALAERGVRTARVVQERPEQRGQRLLLPAVDDNLRPRLDELKKVIATKPLRPCR